MTPAQVIKPRRVAIVTYYFPPLGGVGVQRVLKQATYLPRSGWEPVIFTPRNPVYAVTDPDLARDLPLDIEVHRSYIFEPSRIYWWLAKSARYAARSSARLRGRGADEGIDGPPDTNPLLPQQGSAAPDRRQRLLAGLGRWLLFPDEQLPWVPSAVRSIKRVASARRFDAMISSSPPITAHLVAGLARGSGTPWIADFRDPWIGNAFTPLPPWIHRQLMSRIERWIVERADRSVFATPSLRAMYAHRYPDLADRFVTLTNGYDREDLPPSDGSRPGSGTFRLVYTGSLYGEHELEVFLDGLRLVLERRPEFRDLLRVEFVGWLSRHNRAIAEHASNTLAGIVSFGGFLPRADALRRIASADAGLLIVGDEPRKGLIVPAKLYDYLGLNRQVLAIVPAGDAEDVLRGLDWGVVVRPEPDAIARGIEQVVMGQPRTGPADPEGRYDRIALAAQLATILNAAVESTANGDD